MTFYSNMATTARTLLNKFGAAVTIARTTGGTYDPVTGATVAGTSTVYTPKGILKRYKNNVIDGTRILVGDRELVLDDTVTPLMSDLVTVKGEQWTIVNPETIEPDGTTPIVHFVQVRR